MKYLLGIASAFLLVFGCKQNKQEQEINPSALKFTSTKGVWANPDSFTKPITIPAGLPKPLPVNEPVIIPANLNIKEAGRSNIKIAGKPRLCAPGKEIHFISETIPAVEVIKPVIPPRTIMAKDMESKDRNPSNFSFFSKFHGLNHNNILSMLQDKTGKIWYGTNNGGVSCYDGKTFKSFSTKEGLGGGIVLDMIEDREGNIWFAINGGGVSKYNGKYFTNFTTKEGLVDNTITTIVEDKMGNIWFGGYLGMTKYDGNRINAIENGKEIMPNDGRDLTTRDGKLVRSFTNYKVQGVEDLCIMSLMIDKPGNIWIGGNYGVFRYDGKVFNQFTVNEGLTDNSVSDIVEDKAGNIWLSTHYGGVSCYNGNRVDAIEGGTVMTAADRKEIPVINGNPVKTFTNFTQNEGLPNNTVLKLLEDKKGNIWIGTNSGGASCYDGKTFTTFTDKEGLPNNFVLSMLEDNAGNVWLGTYAGACKYNGRVFTNFTENEGLVNKVVNCITQDKTGNLWFGTNGGGLSCYNSKTFTGFTFKNPAANFVQDIIVDKTGKLWIATFGSGVICYDGKSFTNFTVTEGLNSDFALSICEDKRGDLWFGTYKGASRYHIGDSTGSRGYFTTFSDKEGLIHNTVKIIVEDKKGNLWFGTEGGISRYNGNVVDAIAKDENSQLASKPDIKKSNGMSVKSFTNFSTDEGLLSPVVNDILEDKSGNIWAATAAGVSCYNTQFMPDGKEGFVNFTEKNGLMGSALNLVKDKHENIWIGTGNGVSKLSFKHQEVLLKKNANLNAIREALFYNYDYTDGFMGINCRGNSVFLDNKEKIWWGGELLSCFTPEADIVDTTLPIMQLNTIQLFGEKISWTNLNVVYNDSTGKEIVNGVSSDTTLENGIILHDIKFDGISEWNYLPENLSLPYDNNHLTFNFVGVDMKSKNHMKYQYKLEGLEENWSPVRNYTEAPYGNLPPGEYIFKVKTMNQSGIWSTEYRYAFKVRPPWWKTWWFRILLTIIILGSILYYVRSRERKLVVEKERLEKTVKERTAEVVKQKNVIEEQKHIVEEKHKEITDSIHYAERIQRSFLASKDFLDENLKEYFILFKPKDVVSGDFYWASTLNNGQFALVTADSTGHGVPGAIMSLLNITSLEKATERAVEPAVILNETRKTIIDRLKKDGSSEGGKDGMDASATIYDFKNKKLWIATANNPVWIIRPSSDSETNEVIEIKADKMPVGKHDRDAVSFSQQEFDLKTGDVIYTLTDGFPDQFGGKSGKKFMSKNLRKLLADNVRLPMHKQKELLEITFKDWIGNLEQIDDVTLIGVRI